MIPGGVHAKRRRVGSSLQLDGSDEEQESRASPERKEEPRADQKLACPFYKLNPVRYRECAFRGQLTGSYLRQHLRRVHLDPPRCPVCGDTFQTRTILGNHIRARICEVRPLADMEVLSEETWEQLAALRPHRDSEEQRWFHMWHIMFPNEPQPESPYVDARPEELTLFKDFLLHNTAAQISRGLGSIHDANLRSHQADEMTDLFRKCINGLFEEFFIRLDATPNTRRLDISPKDFSQLRNNDVRRSIFASSDAASSGGPISATLQPLSNIGRYYNLISDDSDLSPPPQTNIFPLEFVTDESNMGTRATRNNQTTPSKEVTRSTEGTRPTSVPPAQSGGRMPDPDLTAMPPRPALLQHDPGGSVQSARASASSENFDVQGESSKERSEVVNTFSRALAHKSSPPPSKQDRTHVHLASFVCSQCGQHFSSKRNLERHAMSTHRRHDEPNSPQLECPYCFKKFPHFRKDNMLRHIRVLHPDEYDKDKKKLQSKP